MLHRENVWSLHPLILPGGPEVGQRKANTILEPLILLSLTLQLEYCWSLIRDGYCYVMPTRRASLALEESEELLIATQTAHILPESHCEAISGEHGRAYLFVQWAPKRF
jgi:hypothetical protein